MRYLKFVILMMVLLLIASNVFGQGRLKQFELYAGAAFPLSPDSFKDYTKVGLSANAQYVLFPSPRFGITFNVGFERFTVDEEKFVEEFSREATGETATFWTASFDINPGADISANLIRIGGGIRPYLTDPASSMQFFLLGQVNYNIIMNDFNVTDLPVDFVNDQLFVVTVNDEEFEEQVEENDENKIGVGGGAGVEIPVGGTTNLIFQGLFNVIFTEDDPTTFVGVTAGIVF